MDLQCSARPPPLWAKVNISADPNLIRGERLSAVYNDNWMPILKLVCKQRVQRLPNKGSGSVVQKKWNTILTKKERLTNQGSGSVEMICSMGRSLEGTMDPDQ
jgi:hypothetical protein